jgi:hypothetical protein
MIRRLRVIAGPDAERVFELPVTGAVELGRGKDTLTRLKDLTVSRTHCRLELEDSRVVLTNTSPSGTLVNDSPVTEQELRGDEVIALGETRLRFEVEDPHDAATIRGGQMVAGLAASIPSLIGKTLDHFQIGKVLAEGAAGTVFRATDTRDRREVALKVLTEQAKPLLQGFPEVLRPVLGLRHPNLVALVGTGKSGPLTGVAAEYVEGESLEKRLKAASAGGGLDWQHALRYGIHLAAALDAMHKSQVVHRTVTPHSILITRADNQARLGALWRARAAQDCPRSDTAEVLRNLAYMPPERATGIQPATAAGDIYNLGAVLYTLLAGRPPFEGSKDADLIGRIAQTDPVPPREFQVTLPPAFDRAVLRALAKRPQDRHASAGELLAILQRIAERPGDGVVQEQKASPAPEGRIVVTCQCGQQLQARKQFAGTRVRCPVCGSFVLLPGKSHFLAPAERSGPQQEGRPPAAIPMTTAATPAATAARPKPRSLLRDIGGYVLAVLLLAVALAVALAAIFWDSSSKNVPGEGGSGNTQQKDKPPPKQAP